MQRHAIIIESFVFLLLGASARRAELIGAPAELRTEILRRTFSPWLILGAHVAFPVVLAVNGTVFLGTFLPPDGALRKVILGVVGTLAVGSATLGLLGAALFVILALAR